MAATDHGHSHGHVHDHRDADARRLRIVLCLSAAYLVAEFVGGLIANSLALLADAGHMLSDVAALGLSLFAVWIARRPATPRRSFGYYRAEILAALTNGAALIAIAVFVFLEALGRLKAPPAVMGGLTTAVATGGLVVNLVGLRVLHAGPSDNLNVRGARLHVLTDAMGSVGAIAGGAAVWLLGWRWADAAVSIVICALVVWSSWSLLRETVSVLMESTPHHIDVDEVRDALRAVPGVLTVHDLHVWSITTGLVALSCHVTVAEASQSHAVLGAVRAVLHERFHVDHTTIQVEPEGFEEGERHE